MSTTLPALGRQHAEIVRATLPLVGAHIDEITDVFYRGLFDRHPELGRDLFNRTDQAAGSQPRALAASIARFAARLVDPAAPQPDAMLARIGHKHASLGVTAGQYEVVHEHLFAAIGAVLGAEVVTEPVAAAWDRVYWLMADALIEQENRLYTRAGAAPGAVFREAVVVARDEDPAGVAVFTVESADPARPLPGFTPGQYISVAGRLPDGARQLRQYSLLGPAEGGRLMFAVKRVDGEPGFPAGEVSTWLYRHIAPGDTLTLTLPFGDVTVDPAATTALVLISAGIGIAPMIAILEQLASDAPHRRVLLAHADRSPHAVPLRARLLELVPRLPALTLEFHYSEHGTGAHFTVNPGALDLPANADFLLCGPTGFLTTVRAALREHGIPDARIRTEQFTPTDWREGTA
ncbi:globin domain-containing protein [Nocardia sp. NPDC024068]|uniref:globin domain-containing protein n=1 Tax=Nocardia sp. NPDC024068 TaxID=3157197 RepID=UPI0033C87F1C